MDLETFRTKQGPYKDLYARDARAAMLTLKAKGTADVAAVTCKVETGRGLAIAGIVLGWIAIGLTAVAAAAWLGYGISNL